MNMQEDHRECNSFPERREMTIVCQEILPSNASSLGMKLIHGIMGFPLISLCCQIATKPLYLL